MNEPRRQASLLTTGLLGLIGLLILVGGLLWGQRLNPWRDTQDIRVAFSTSDGIGIGDAVYLNGVVVGSVSDIELERDRVLLELRLPRELPLTQDASFQLGTLDLMGGHAVFILNGSGGPFHSPDSLRLGENRPGTNELLQQAQGMLTSLDRLAVKLEGLLPAATEPLPLHRIAADIEQLTGEARQLLGNLERDRARLSGQLTGLLTDADTLLAETGPSLRELLSTATGSAANLDLLLEEVRAALQQPGTLQKLAGDSTLYIQTLSAVTELDSLLRAIAEHGLFRFHKKKDE